MLGERLRFFGILIPGLSRKLTIGFNQPLRVTVGNLATTSSPCHSEGKGISLFRDQINDACIDVLEGVSQRPSFYSPLLGWRIFWR